VKLLIPTLGVQGGVGTKYNIDIVASIVYT
jgi:phage shock protein PspC (stress-responsive transcriptional regulator)